MVHIYVVEDQILDTYLHLSPCLLLTASVGCLYSNVLPNSVSGSSPGPGIGRRLSAHPGSGAGPSQPGARL